MGKVTTKRKTMPPQPYPGVQRAPLTRAETNMHRLARGYEDNSKIFDDPEVKRMVLEGISREPHRIITRGMMLLPGNGNILDSQENFHSAQDAVNKTRKELMLVSSKRGRSRSPNSKKRMPQRPVSPTSCRRKSSTSCKGKSPTSCKQKLPTSSKRKSLKSCSRKSSTSSKGRSPKSCSRKSPTRIKGKSPSYNNPTSNKDGSSTSVNGKSDRSVSPTNTKAKLARPVSPTHSSNGKQRKMANPRTVKKVRHVPYNLKSAKTRHSASPTRRSITVGKSLRSMKQGNPVSPIRRNSKTARPVSPTLCKTHKVRPISPPPKSVAPEKPTSPSLNKAKMSKISTQKISSMKRGRPVSPTSRSIKSSKPISPTPRSAKSAKSIALTSRTIKSEKSLSPSSRFIKSAKPISPTYSSIRSAKPISPTYRSVKFVKQLSPTSKPSPSRPSTNWKIKKPTRQLAMQNARKTKTPVKRIQDCLKINQAPTNDSKSEETVNNIGNEALPMSNQTLDSTNDSYTLSSTTPQMSNNPIIEGTSMLTNPIRSSNTSTSKRMSSLAVSSPPLPPAKRLSKPKKSGIESNKRNLNTTKELQSGNKFSIFGHPRAKEWLNKALYSFQAFLADLI